MKRPTGEELLALAEEAVRAAKTKGADEVEVYAVHQSNALVEFRGRLGDVQETAEGGICVRLAIGRRTGWAGNPGLTAESAAKATDRAIVNARSLPEDARFRHYPDPRPSTLPPTRIDARIAAPDADRILGDAQRAADGIRDQDDVTYVAFALHSSSVVFAVANGRGLAAWDQDARESFKSELRVSRGGAHKTANEFSVERVPVAERHELDALIAAAAGRARAGLDARPFDGVVDAVVFDSATAMLITGPWLDALAIAGAKREGLAERVGQPVASSAITIRDTPHDPRASRNQRVDDEGVPTRETTLVERGVLKELTTNAFVAHQRGNASTGNGYRPFENRWTATPKMRHSAVDIAAGSKSLDELLAGIDRGIVVRDYLLGYFTSNLVTGDFSTVAPLAFLVEKGSIVHALPPTTVAGNGYRMMESVEAVSRERRTLQRGTFPALRVRGLSCAT